METILSAEEAEHILIYLSEEQKKQIESDKVRFGEYFIAQNEVNFYRINPINVITRNGINQYINPASMTII